MPLRVLFFDAAGTLIRPAVPVGVTYAQFAARHGIQVEPGELMRAFGSIWQATPSPLHPPGQPAADEDRGWWHSLVGAVFACVLGVPLAGVLHDELFDELYGHYAKPEAWLVFADVLPALNDLAQDHRLLILSNFDRRLRSILAGHDLLRFFEHVIISSEVGASKPHARMFETAMVAAGVQPEQCLHIGDDVKCDLAGAQNLGLPVFHVERPANGLDVMVQKVRAGAYSGLRGTLT